MTDSENYGTGTPQVDDGDSEGEFNDSFGNQRAIDHSVEGPLSLSGYDDHVVDLNNSNKIDNDAKCASDIEGGLRGMSVPDLSKIQIRTASSFCEEKTLLEEIREVLPQSYLIFLLADLRLMSGTGRINTRFETLVIDSDVYERNSAAQLACNFVIPDDDGWEVAGSTVAGGSRTKSVTKIVSRAPDTETKSLSPAQIMSLLMLELASTFINVKKTKNDRNPNDPHDEAGAFGGFNTYQHDIKARRTLEDSMESLLRAYARMISDDLVTEIPSVRRRRESITQGLSFANLNGSRTSPAAAGSTRPGIAHKEYPSLRSIVEGVSVEGEWNDADSFSIEELSKRKTTWCGDLADEDESKTEPRPKNATTDEEDPEFQREDTSEPPTPPISTSQTRNKFFSSNGELHLSQLNPLTADYRRHMAEKLGATRKNVTQGINERVDILLPANREANTQKEFQELANALFEQGQSNQNVMSSLGGSYSAPEMITLMRNGVQTRNDSRLEFLSRLFNDGSVSQLMAESHSRIVWINDWYPLKDLTYAIAVDKRQKRVLVVFRGAITSADWNSISNYSFESIDNPVEGTFAGKKDKLRVFSGFYRYLFRVRKDTGTTKYSEIANLAHKYGMEKIGNDYKLFVTGHSLGGALTLFFTFFASTEKRFTRNGPVKGITFGAPYVGGHAFADTFRHQERSGKLQVVRVSNNDDPVPRLPLNFAIGRRGCHWRHVGIGVVLPHNPWFRKWKPRVQYFGKEKSWIGSTLRGYQNNFLLHLPWFQLWNVPKMHTLFELQDRLMYGIQKSEPGGEFDLLKQTMDALYAGLEKNDFQRLEKKKR